MESVTEHNFIEGVNRIIKRIVKNNTNSLEMEMENLPIKAFEQRDNALFIFNGKEWSLMTVEQFDCIFNKITKGLINQLKLWQDKHKNRLFDSGITEKYIENVTKLTGGNLTREQQYHKIKQGFYNHLKINIKNIVQYEFVF